MFSERNILGFKIFAILFLVLYSILAYYNRIVYEDYSGVYGNYFYGGVWPNAIQTYNTWGGNLFSFATGFYILRLSENGIPLFVYHALELFLFWIGFRSILKNIGFKIDDINLFALIFSLILFFCTVNVGESWFWILASTNYTLALSLALIGLGLSLKPVHTIFDHFISCILFLYVGAASEPFALMCIIFCTTYLFYKIWRKQKWDKLYLVILLSLLAGFIFTETASGTIIRKSAMPDINIFLAVKRTFGAIAKFWLFEFYKILPGFCLSVLIGIYLAKEINFKSDNYKILFHSFLIFNALLFLSFLPVCYIMGEAGPYRSWHHIGLYTMTLGGSTGLFIGNKKAITNYSITNLFTYLFCVFLTYQIVNQTLILEKFTTAYDERTQWLQALQQSIHRQKEIIAPLPASGMIYSQECSPDTNDFSYKYFRKYLGIGFHFEVTKKTKK